MIPEVATNRSDDWARQMLADHADDPCVQEVQEAIECLEPDQWVALVALMWLGWGDYDRSELHAAMVNAAESTTDITDPAAYLLAHPLVADYLLEGLIQHGNDCEE